MDSSNTTKPKLVDQLRTAIRLRHYSPRTEEAYAGWVRRYVLFHRKRHPAELGEAEVRQFLIHLAEEMKVSAATQNQALNALVFLYREVLQSPFGQLETFVRATRPEHLPVVLTKAEVRSLLGFMGGVPKMIAVLMYGSGVRLLEYLRSTCSPGSRLSVELLARRPHPGGGYTGAVLITWDPSKAKANLRKHGINFQEAATVFTDTLSATFPSEDHSENEQRFVTIGLSANKQILVVAHTEDDNTIRIISARSPTRQERRFYEKGRPA